MIIQRKSNIEFLRILSIFLITMHHLVIHGSNACGYNIPYSFDQGVFGIIINSFCIVGVNVFILISGWFGIKNPIKTILHILFFIIVLSTIMNAGLYLYKGSLGSIDFFKTYNFKYNWFIADYIILALLSPFIERSIKKMEFKDFTALIIVWTIINIVLCYNMEIENNDGYSLLNFIYLYYLARYMRISSEKGLLFKKSPSFFMILYVGAALLCSLVYFAFIFAGKSNIIGGIRYFSYNNPLVLISSIGLFMCFARMNVRYIKIINIFAGGALAVFLMQSSMQLCSYRVVASKMIFAEYSYLGLLLFAIAIYICCSIGGIIVQYVWQQIESYYKNRFERWKNIY